jgi:transposase
VERAVAPWRRDLEAAARATVRFETPPGRQLQIDFGERRVEIAGEMVRVHLLVTTLGYSRRRYVRAFRNERQGCWLEGIEGAFRHFGGVPEEVLLDNPRALVVHHDPATREVRFHERLLAFINKSESPPTRRRESSFGKGRCVRRSWSPSVCPFGMDVLARAVVLSV